MRNPMAYQERLQELGITLEEAPKSMANYVPFVQIGNMIYISGQLPFKEGVLLYKGKLGDNVTLEEGQLAARQCAINIITQLKAACQGDLSKVERCVRLGGFVNCTNDFEAHPKVINGASDLMVAVFGEAGKHARAAIGTSSLPLGVSVEVEASFLLKESA